MTDSLVNFFIDLFGNINKDIVVFIISMMPILELRGGLLAVLHNLDKKKSFVCILAGVFLASVIMTIISYGFVGNLIR